MQKSRTTRTERNIAPIEPNRPYLIPEVAQILDVNASTVWKYSRVDGLIVRNTGRGVILGSDLLAWISSRPPKQRKTVASG